MFEKWMLLLFFIGLLLERSKAVELKNNYHQTDYKIKLEIIEFPDYNNTYVKNLTAGLSWHNRTTRVINGHGTLLKEIHKDFKLQVQVYKFLSNEYRFFPITLTMQCKNTAGNIFGLHDLFVKYSNLHAFNYKTCIFPKGYYYMRNGIFDESQLPPYIPTGRYKIDVKLYNDGDYIFTLNIFVEILENKKWFK